MQLRNLRDLVRIESHDVYLGSPTRLDIYSAGGQMFLARGATVYRADTVEKLQTEGFKLAQSNGAAKHPQEPVFLRIGDIADKLVRFERALAAGQVVGVFSLKFRALAQELIRCCDQDADAALAQSYLNYHHPYSVLHHILVAVVVSVLTKVFGWSGTDRMSLVAAALTHDLGALPLRDSLGQSALLDATQKSLLHQHPTTGIQLLTQFGVTDALWLQAVQDHHEHIDGSGYPADSAAPEFAITAALAPEVCLRFQTKVNQSWCVPHTASEFPYPQ